MTDGKDGKEVGSLMCWEVLTRPLSLVDHPIIPKANPIPKTRDRHKNQQEEEFLFISWLVFTSVQEALLRLFCRIRRTTSSWRTPSSTLMMSPGDILNGKKREEERKIKSHSLKPSCHLEILLAGIEVVQKSDPAWFAHMFANLKFLKMYGHLLVVGWRMIFFFHSHSHPLLIGFSLFCGGGDWDAGIRKPILSRFASMPAKFAQKEEARRCDTFDKSCHSTSLLKLWSSRDWLSRIVNSQKLERRNVLWSCKQVLGAAERHSVAFDSSCQALSNRIEVPNVTIWDTAGYSSLGCLIMFLWNQCSSNFQLY